MSNSLLASSRIRSSVELKTLFRDRSQVVFTFAFPMLLLVVFGSVFTKEILPGVSFSQYFAAGLIASGVVYTGFQNLAIVIPMEREDGTLKRLRGTPMPLSAYFVGKVARVVVTYVAQVAILIAIGAAFFHLVIPSSLEAWATFLWVSILGLMSCTLLGIAFSSVPKNPRAAPAIVTPIVLVAQFTSGVFFQFNTLPKWMQDLASLFPLKWLCEGMRSVFLPSQASSLQPGGSYQLPMVAAVLVIWTVIGLVLSIRTFRFTVSD